MINTIYPDSELTSKIIGCAIEVHKHLGNGFQELIYQRALEFEMTSQGLSFMREHTMHVFTKTKKLEPGELTFLLKGKSWWN